MIICPLIIVVSSLSLFGKRTERRDRVQSISMNILIPVNNESISIPVSRVLIMMVILLAMSRKDTVSRITRRERRCFLP